VISKLRLQNFKKHDNTEILFTPGLNGIFGPNYSGKTSILYGILFALGGVSCVPGSNMEKKGGGRMSVDMSFSVGEVEYQIHRTKTKCVLYCEEEILASGTSPVNEKIETLLGLSMKRFRQLKYVEQKMSHALLTASSSEIHNIINELTGAQDVENAISALTKIRTSCEGGLESLGDVDQGELSTLEKAINVSENSSKKLEQSLKAAKSTKQSRERDEAESRRVAEDGHLSRSKFLLEKVNLAKLETSIKLREEELSDTRVELGKDTLERLSAVRASLSRQSKETEASELRRRELDRTMQRLEKGLTKVENKLAVSLEEGEEVAEKIRNVGGEIKDVERPEEGFSAAILTLAERKAEGLAFLKRYNNLKGSDKCPTCGSTVTGCLSSWESKVEHYEQEIEISENAIKNVEGARSRLTKLEKSKTSLTLKLENIAEIVSDSEEDRDLHNKSLRESKLEVRDIPETAGKDWDRLQKELEKSVASVASYQALLRQEKSLSSNLKDGKESLSKVKVSEEITEEQVRVLQDLFGIARQELREAELWFSSTEKKVNENASFLRHSKPRLVEMQSKAKEVERLSTRSTTSKELTKFLRKNKDRLMSDVWSHFMALASTFASNCTGGVIESIQRQESGAFTFVEGGHDMSVADASGAQAAIMGLGVQLALAEEARCPLDILLVDEPTADMDPEHSISATSLLAASGAQVIAVSHSSMDSTLCNNVIHLER